MLCKRCAKAVFLPFFMTELGITTVPELEFRLQALRGFVVRIRPTNISQPRKCNLRKNGRRR
jgi:hypothetical protein